MSECENGSGLRPGISGQRPVTIRRADLRDIALPNLQSYGVTPVYAADGLRIIGFNVNTQELLEPDNLSLYGVVYGPEIASNFCASPPPTNFPGADPGTNQLSAIAAENQWRELCYCFPRRSTPGCELFSGRGQCSGVPYTVEVETDRLFIDGQGNEQIITSTLTRACPGEFFDPDILYGPLGAIVESQSGNRSILRISGFNQFGAPIVVNVSDESSNPIVTYRLINMSRCDGLDDDCCRSEEPPPPPPPPEPYPPGILINPEGEDTVIVFVPCCEEEVNYEYYQENGAYRVDYEGLFQDDTGGAIYGVCVQAVTIPPGTSREPEQFGINARLDLGRMRLFHEAGGYTGWMVIDSRDWSFLDKANAPFSRFEAKARPGTVFDVRVIRRREVTENGG